MRNFLISLACIGLILSAWICFSVYSSNTIQECLRLSSYLVEQCLVDEDWESAKSTFDQLTNRWNKYKRAASYFLDAKDINEIDSTFQRARLYVEAKDESNASGEISYLESKIRLLHENESLTLENVF